VKKRLKGEIFMRLMKCIVITFLAFVTCVINPKVVWAQRTQNKGGDDSYKAPFVPQTEYEKKLAEFSKPKPGVLNTTESEYGENITKEEHQILNEMKIKESKRIMLENDGSKFKDEYKDSLPVQGRGAASSIENLAKKQENWSYYLPQHWKAYGDAFVTNKNNIAGKQMNLVGHAALGGKHRSTTLETSFGSTLQWARNKWFRPAKKGVGSRTPGNHLYYAKADNGTWAQLRIKHASVAQYEKAHNYGATRVGATYNWHLQEKYDGFYCSELVAFAWRFGGNLDIIPQKGDWNFIMPMDLYDSPVTYAHRGVIL